MIKVKAAETPQEIEACLEIRRIVFVDEQNVPHEYEIDGLDDAAYHMLALKDGQPVGTARALLLDDGKAAKIGRVSILKSERGLGIGHMIMKAFEEDPRLASVAFLKLEAQTHALPFYEKLGYEAYSDEFDDCGIPHLRMRKARNEIGC